MIYMETPKTEFTNTINRSIQCLHDISKINEHDCYAFELSLNNILLSPDEKYYMENKNNYLHYYRNALKVLKIPKSGIEKTSTGDIKINKKEYLTLKLSPYTYPECILSLNNHQTEHIIFDKDQALKLVHDYDCSNL